LGRLREEIPQRQFSQWVTPLQVEQTGTEVTLYAPNQYVFEGAGRFFSLIQRALLTLEGECASKVSLLVGASKFLEASTEWFHGTKQIIDANLSWASTHVDSNSASSCSLNPYFRLDNFIPGKSNQFAKSAANLAAENPGKAYNPLFFYGKVGLGKTHLMQAVGNFLLEKDNRSKVVYLHAERFVAEMVKALQTNVIEEFKKYYRSIDVLLIDDVQFFSRKERSQETLFHIFNVLLQGGQQIVLASDRFPKEITGIDERLLSRFNAGLTVSIEPPDLETRVAILLSKAKDLGLYLSEEMAHFVAKRLYGNVRELEAALKALSAKIDLTAGEVSWAKARAVLKDLFGIQEKTISPNAVLEGVSAYFSLKKSQLLSVKRDRTIVRPRQIAMTLCKELTTLSLVEIGDFFGGKDHTTVLHACRQIQKLRATQQSVSTAFNEIMRQLIQVK
jgi:chromosomal replication initiator protein